MRQTVACTCANAGKPGHWIACPTVREAAPKKITRDALLDLVEKVICCGVDARLGAPDAIQALYEAVVERKAARRRDGRLVERVFAVRAPIDCIDALAGAVRLVSLNAFEGTEEEVEAWAALDEVVEAYLKASGRRSVPA